MIRGLTVYLVADNDVEWESLSDLCRKRGGSVLRIPRSRFAFEIPSASARGAVVVVVGSDAEARLALGLGADEVVRYSEWSPEAIDRAFDRATLRASARALRDTRTAGQREADEGLALLGSALGEQIIEPLHAATLECAQVMDAVRVLLGISDDLVGWAALSAPTAELRRLAARRLAAPSTAEIRESLVRIHSSITDARTTADRIRELVADSAGDGALAADKLTSDFAVLIGPTVAPIASLEVASDSECSVRVPAAFYVSVATLLVSNALAAFRDANKVGGRIVLSTHEADGAAVLTVEDDAGEMIPDIGRGVALQAGESARGAAGLAALRERLAALGGDLLVQSDETGTQVRAVFAPRSESADLPAGVEAASASDSEPRVDKLN